MMELQSPILHSLLISYILWEGIPIPDLIFLIFCGRGFSSVGGDSDPRSYIPLLWEGTPIPDLIFLFCGRGFRSPILYSSSVGGDSDPRSYILLHSLTFCGRGFRSPILYSLTFSSVGGDSDPRSYIPLLWAGNANKAFIPGE